MEIFCNFKVAIEVAIKINHEHLSTSLSMSFQALYSSNLFIPTKSHSFTRRSYHCNKLCERVKEVESQRRLLNNRTTK